MSAVDFAFLCFSILAVGAAVCVVWAPNVLHAAFFLIASFFGVAGLYVLLLADFVALIQVLLYIGGVVILIVFAVMLSDRSDVAVGETKRASWAKWGGGTMVGLAIIALLCFIVGQMPWKESTSSATSDTTTLYALGHLLLTRYLVPFELASILLLGALIGAIMIARQKNEQERDK